MIVYEVNLEVDAAVVGEFRIWLDGHVAQILALPGFTDAALFEVREPAPAPHRHALCVQYRLRDPAALESYLRDHAPRLRADGATRFPGKFTATRRVMLETGGPA
jgi:hypothetical protein